jgi:hypothetical protein
VAIVVYVSIYVMLMRILLCIMCRLAPFYNMGIATGEDVFCAVWCGHDTSFKEPGWETSVMSTPIRGTTPLLGKASLRDLKFSHPNVSMFGMLGSESLGVHLTTGPWTNDHLTNMRSR